MSKLIRLRLVMVEAIERNVPFSRKVSDSIPRKIYRIFFVSVERRNANKTKR